MARCTCPASMRRITCPVHGFIRAIPGTSKPRPKTVKPDSARALLTQPHPTNQEESDA